jgi:hypothetical protein
MTKRLSILAVVAAALAAGLFISLPARAVPPVSWQPAPFDVAVPPGGRLPTKVTAIVGSAIPATRVEVTPSLAPYVASIEPSSLPALAAGSQVTINLVFQVATGTPFGTIDGTLKFRKASGTSTQAQPLPIVLTIGELLYPPDPGEAGKQTLEGIDSDGDGVRDDIQRYIELKHPEAPLTRAALRQYVLPLQAALLDADSEEAALQHDETLSRADDCLIALIGFKDQVEARNALLAEALNTEERSRAYILYDRQLGGRVFSLRGLSEITPALCDFDVQGFGGVR